MSSLRIEYANYLNWSRRIDNRHRLVYRVRKGHLEILSCKGHYDVGQAAGYGPSPTRCN